MLLSTYIIFICQDCYVVKSWRKALEDAFMSYSEELSCIEEPSKYLGIFIQNNSYVGQVWVQVTSG